MVDGQWDPQVLITDQAEDLENGLLFCWLLHISPDADVSVLSASPIGTSHSPNMARRVALADLCERCADRGPASDEYFIRLATNL